MGTSEYDPGAGDRPAWAPGRKVGAKRALKPKQIWGIRFYLDHHRRLRDRALFDVAIDSKLRGCDVVRVKIGDIVRRTKASIIYEATGNLRAVQILLGHSKIENTVRYLGVDVRMPWPSRWALKFEADPLGAKVDRRTVSSALRLPTVRLQAHRRLPKAPVRFKLTPFTTQGY